MTTPYERLSELGVLLPSAGAPQGSYLPFIEVDGLAYLSGALPFDEGGVLLHPGHVGGGVTVEDAAEAARVCAVNLIARLHVELGSLDRIERWVKITGFVASSPVFHAQPAVVNGASDFLVEVFGESGRHARSAVGVASLPLGSSVEIEAIVKVRE